MWLECINVVYKLIYKWFPPFVEIALLYEEKRVATVTATDISEIYILRKIDFDHVLKDHPEIRAAIEEIASGRLLSVNKMRGNQPK